MDGCVEVGLASAYTNSAIGNSISARPSRTSSGVIRPARKRPFVLVALHARSLELAPFPTRSCFARLLYPIPIISAGPPDTAIHGPVAPARPAGFPRRRHSEGLRTQCQTRRLFAGLDVFPAFHAGVALDGSRKRGNYIWQVGGERL